LFLTPEGRALRRKIESGLEDLGKELSGLRGALAKAKGAANEGWRLLDDFGDVVLGEDRGVDAGRYQRPSSEGFRPGGSVS
jgi:hypothetical protein